MARVDDDLAVIGEGLVHDPIDCRDVGRVEMSEPQEIRPNSLLTPLINPFRNESIASRATSNRARTRAFALSSSAFLVVRVALARDETARPPARPRADISTRAGSAVTTVRLRLIQRAVSAAIRR